MGNEMDLWHQIQHKILDAQDPIQKVLFPFAPESVRGPKMSLQNALLIVKTEAGRFNLTQMDIQYLDKLVDQITDGKNMGRKNSLFDAAAVAFLLIHLHQYADIPLS